MTQQRDETHNFVHVNDNTVAKDVPNLIYDLAVEWKANRLQ